MKQTQSDKGIARTESAVSMDKTITRGASMLSTTTNYCSSRNIKLVFESARARNHCSNILLSAVKRPLAKNQCHNQTTKRDKREPLAPRNPRQYCTTKLASAESTHYNAKASLKMSIMRRPT